MAPPSTPFVTPVERELVLLQAKKLPFPFKHEGLTVSRAQDGLVVGYHKGMQYSVAESASETQTFSSNDGVQHQSQRDSYWEHLKYRATQQYLEDRTKAVLPVEEIAQFEQRGIRPELVQDVQLGVADCGDKTCRGRCKFDREFWIRHLPQTAASKRVSGDAPALNDLLKDSTAVLPPSSGSSEKVGIIGQGSARGQ